MDNSITPPSITTHYLSLTQRLSFSVGHIFNDLVSAFWFTYLLIFMHSVLGFSSKISGTLMLIGQVADGLATPFVGIECDRNLNWLICKYGKRKCWHLVGSLLVFLSFPFLFHTCFGCEMASENAQAVYYIAFIIMCQFGWASVQISHLSLIPDLTPLSSERTELNAWRYASTVIANITVYVLMFFLLESGKDADGKEKVVSPSDAKTFTEVSIVILALGFIFSLIFHIGVREKSHLNSEDDRLNSNNHDDDIAIKRPMKWTSWFRQPQFYKIALLYMGTRLTINLTQVYIPNYLQQTLYLNKKSIASVPLTAYTSGFVSSLFKRYIIEKIGKNLTFLLGCCLSLIACTCIYFGSNDFFKNYGIFMVAVIIGISNSTMLITSLSITNDLIGKNTQSGAFVFGAMSFVDKVSNGLSVWIIEFLTPCKQVSCKICDYYYRDVLAFVVGGSSAIAIAALALLSLSRIGHFKRSMENLSDSSAAAEATENPATDIDVDERTALLNHST